MFERRYFLKKGFMVVAGVEAEAAEALTDLVFGCF